jgi:hypothetical protein
MNSATIIAIVGLITTALSPFLLWRLTTKNQKAAWQRDVHAEIYTEALAYCQRLEWWMDFVTDAYSAAQKQPASGMPVNLLTARLRLLAPHGLFEAWEQVLLLEARLLWELQENYPGATGNPADYPHRDHPDIAKLEAGIKRFYDLTRTAFGD